MRVFQHVRRTVNATGGDGVFDHQRVDIIDSQRLGPIVDERIQLILIFAARQMCRIARIIAQFGTTHRIGQPLPERILIGADHELAVFAAIDVGRGNALQHGT